MNAHERPRRAVPHIREFLADSLTPLGVYRRLARISPLRFLLESVAGGESVSRFSFLGAGPAAIYRLYADRLEVERGGEARALPGPPLEALRRVAGAIAAEPGPIPFTGGLVGAFGYDLIRLVERLPARPPDPFGLPLALLARFDNLVVFDHARQRVLTIANEIEGEVDTAAAERELARLAGLLTAGGEGGAVAMPERPPARLETPEPSLDGAAYRRAVATAKEHIAAGDIFQVVLARRWKVPQRVEPLALYRALRMVNPSPYMVLLELTSQATAAGGRPEMMALVGASPEMLVRKTGRRVETRPIAGTRPRGADEAGDERLAADLLADPKERAEHVMLVDLGRNDLGRVAVAGSVRVPTFLQVERYSHVMHLVSSVEAELAPGHDALDALFACFPAGTVSGAPKIRAMEIIDALEPEARGPYAGAVGYLSFTGDLDTCIAIRTLVVERGETSVTAGAGIVADSDPAAEERETENKAAALLAAVALAEALEEDGGAMILVIDNYDSFTYNLVQLIAGSGSAREVRVLRNDAASAAEMLALGAQGIVISPGPGRPEAAGVCVELLRRRAPVPILGVCLGHQAMGVAFGAEVDRAPYLMHGKTSPVRHLGRGPFAGLPDPFEATRYHSLAVREETLPAELVPIAWTSDGILMGLAHRDLPYWGVQFHPESVLTGAGPALVANFLRLASGAPAADVDADADAEARP